MRLLNLILIVLALSFSKNMVAQTDNAIGTIGQEHMYPFTFDSAFHGEGWEKIKDLAENHKYFLIGEDHGIAEIPRFTQAIANHVNYDLFVTEIDSVTAAIGKEIASQTPDRIDAFHTQNPSALSFYSAQEEFELLRQLVKSNADIWGLDQVSLLSTGIVLRRLSEVCQSKTVKELAIKLAGQSDRLFLEATQTGNYDTLFIFSSKPKHFDALKLAVQNENQEAKSIVSDIENSWKIYNGIDQADHHTRIKEMKSKLLAYYLNSASPEKKHSKVLYKFGAYHVGKAESMFKGYDVGNFVSNIAEAEGASSYHLMVVGKKGKLNSFLLAEGMASQDFDMSDKNSPLRGLLPLANLGTEDQWAFFDLKSIRTAVEKEKLTIENRFLRTALKGYDGLVIIPETTPSTHYKKIDSKP